MRTILLTLFATILLAGTASAQRSVTPAIERDPVMEADASHNLDVARQYFKTRQAYKSVLMRFEETFDSYPEFSKIDEFLYLAGMSSRYLAEGKGKQKIDPNVDKDKDKYTPEKLRENAVAYLDLIVRKYPESQFRAEAESALKKLRADK